MAAFGGKLTMNMDKNIKSGLYYESKLKGQKGLMRTAFGRGGGIATTMMRDMAEQPSRVVGDTRGMIKINGEMINMYDGTEDEDVNMVEALQEAGGKKAAEVHSSGSGSGNKNKVGIESTGGAGKRRSSGRDELNKVYVSEEDAARDKGDREFLVDQAYKLLVAELEAGAKGIEGQGSGVQRLQEAAKFWERKVEENETSGIKDEEFGVKLRDKLQNYIEKKNKEIPLING